MKYLRHCKKLLTEEFNANKIVLFMILKANPTDVGRLYSNINIYSASHILLLNYINISPV
jgi:hypothetical protein